MEHLIRPHLEAGSFKQAQQTIRSYLERLVSPTAAQFAEAAYWSCQANDFSFATGLYQRACEQLPEHPSYHYNLATTLRIIGDIDGAEIALNRHLTNSPKDAEAYWLKVHLRPQGAEKKQLESLYNLTSEAIPPKQRVHAWHALGKIYEDAGQDKACFDAYTSGASLRRRYLKYSVAQDEAIMQGIAKTFSKTWCDNTASGDQGKSNIFIVGMPRSGTTLVENLLGAHEGVAMGGELNAFSSSMMTEAGREGKPAHMQQAITQASRSDFEAIGKRYEVAVGDYQNNSPRLTDKLPLNFLYLGLMHKALPQARIIHVERNPMDTVWSVYKHLFTHAYPFSYNLDEIAGYYIAYRRLMAHWQGLLGDNILHVSYEALVKNPTEEIRGITEFCNISYDPECLDFYQRQTQVATASAVQVRQPINDRSVGQWKRFASQLERVRARFADAGLLDDSA